MKNNKNAYAELLDTMREMGSQDNPLVVEIGKIVSTKPFIVRVNDIDIDEDNIYIADNLQSGYRRGAKLEGIGKLKASMPGQLGAITSPAGSGTLDSVNITTLENEASIEGTIEFSHYFRTGDLVALTPFQNNQKFIIAAVS